ncbi:unnamed protein product [Xylocopa violacea]|uniref:Uncharacterized protein n=1 Tax=Xylocopa violacea TaxID=135666 RepID=A0ABP1NYP6_XYLVO
MIITRKVARWALLLMREALGRTLGGQKRVEQGRRHDCRAMLPHPGRVDDNIDRETETVATDLHRTSSCVALALPFSYYRYYYPRAGLAASLLKPERPTLIDDHEDDSLPLLTAGFDEQPEPEPTYFDSAASTVRKPKEQQDGQEHGVQETENVAGPTDGEVTVPASVDSNRVNLSQNVRARFSA